MPKFFIILPIIFLVFTPILAPRSEILASDSPEIASLGENSPSGQNISAYGRSAAGGQNIKETASGLVKTLNKLTWIVEKLENIIKKAWSLLSKAYYWIKGKMYEPVNPEDIEIKI